MQHDGPLSGLDRRRHRGDCPVRHRQEDGVGTLCRRSQVVGVVPHAEHVITGGPERPFEGEPGPACTDDPD